MVVPAARVLGVGRVGDADCEQEFGRALAGGDSLLSFFFLMIRRPPRSTRLNTLFPYTTLFRSLAAGLFVFPVLVHAAWNWSASGERRASPLTPGLVDALRDEVPERAVVYSDLETSYRIAAFAPVYVAAAPPGHVADTEQN